MKITRSLSLALEAVSRTIAILAQKGAGKTYTAMKLAELMLEASAQIVCLDPTGVWWGLKADGEGKGFPILVMGGAHGDLPLPATAGALVADFLVNSGQSVVLDLSSFNSNAEQNRFVTDFAERPYRAKAEARTSLHLFLDEADSFAPQRPQPGEARMLGALEAIVRRGRSRGLGMTMISQRPAVLNKNVLTQADLLIALRVVGIQDHKALGDWTAINGSRDDQKQFMAELPSLPTGTAFFWSPSWLGIFEKGIVLKRRTFDSSKTPEPGKVVAPPKLATVDIDKLSKELTATVEAAKENDPKALKAKIARLEKELGEQGKYAPISQTDRESFQRIAAALDPFAADVKALASCLRASLGWPVEKEKPPTAPTVPVAKTQSSPPPFIAEPPATPTEVQKWAADTKAIVSEGTGLNEGQFRVLRSVYWLRNESITPEKAAFYSNYTNNSTFRAALAKLRALGHLEGWKITPSGVAMIPPAAALDKPTGAELREWLRPKLSLGENKLLDVLMNHRGRSVELSHLADQAGYTQNSTFRAGLATLRKLDIASGGAKEGVKASEVFFS